MQTRYGDCIRRKSISTPCTGTGCWSSTTRWPWRSCSSTNQSPWRWRSPGGGGPPAGGPSTSGQGSAPAGGLSTSGQGSAQKGNNDDNDDEEPEDDDDPYAPDDDYPEDDDDNGNYECDEEEEDESTDDSQDDSDEYDDIYDDDENDDNDDVRAPGEYDDDNDHPNEKRKCESPLKEAKKRKTGESSMPLREHEERVETIVDVPREDEMEQIPQDKSLLSPQLTTPYQSCVQDTPPRRHSPCIKDQTVTEQIPATPLEFVHPGIENTEPCENRNTTEPFK